VSETLDQIVELVRSDFEAYLATGPDLALRDQHSREHFSYQGELEILQDVPEEWCYGLFERPIAYQVVVRFSPNAALPISHDAHGMAIKVLDLGYGLEQDLLMANSQVFLARTEEDVLALMQAKHDDDLKRYLFPGADPREWRIRALLNMLSMTRREVADPLAIRYYSATTMRCGPHAVRLSASPWRSLGDNAPEGIFFDLQLQHCPEDLIDDPMRRCKTSWHPVAELRLTEKLPSGEDLSFGPHHHLPEHEPLGQMAGVRAAVYPVIAQMRHEYNLSRAPRT
jgi:hypothetical protein